MMHTYFHLWVSCDHKAFTLAATCLTGTKNLVYPCQYEAIDNCKLEMYILLFWVRILHCTFLHLRVLSPNRLPAIRNAAARLLSRPNRLILPQYLWLCVGSLLQDPIQNPGSCLQRLASEGFGGLFWSLHLSHAPAEHQSFKMPKALQSTVD